MIIRWVVPMAPPPRINWTTQHPPSHLNLLVSETCTSPLDLLVPCHEFPIQPETGSNKSAGLSFSQIISSASFLFFCFFVFVFSVLCVFCQPPHRRTKFIARFRVGKWCNKKSGALGSSTGETAPPIFLLISRISPTNRKSRSGRSTWLGGQAFLHSLGGGWDPSPSLFYFPLKSSLARLIGGGGWKD